MNVREFICGLGMIRRFQMLAEQKTKMLLHQKSDVRQLDSVCQYVSKEVKKLITCRM